MATKLLVAAVLLCVFATAFRANPAPQPNHNSKAKEAAGVKAGTATPHAPTAAGAATAHATAAGPSTGTTGHPTTGTTGHPSTGTTHSTGSTGHPSTGTTGPVTPHHVTNLGTSHSSSSTSHSSSSDSSNGTTTIRSSSPSPSPSPAGFIDTCLVDFNGTTTSPLASPEAGPNFSLFACVEGTPQTNGSIISNNFIHWNLICVAGQTAITFTFGPYTVTAPVTSATANACDGAFHRLGVVVRCLRKKHLIRSTWTSTSTHTHIFVERFNFSTSSFSGSSSSSSSHSSHGSSHSTGHPSTPHGVTAHATGSTGHGTGSTGHASTGHASTPHASTPHASTPHGATPHKKGHRKQAGTAHAATAHAATAHATAPAAATAHASTGHASTGHATGNPATPHAGTAHGTGHGTGPGTGACGVDTDHQPQFIVINGSAAYPNSTLTPHVGFVVGPGQTRFRQIVSASTCPSNRCDRVQVDFYIDNVLIETVFVNFPEVAPHVIANSLVVGSHFVGEIANATLVDRALSPAEVAQRDSNTNCCAPPSASATPTVSPSVSPSPSPVITGRLIIGLNIQGAGGAANAAVVAGTAFAQVLVCPAGATVPLGASCPNDGTNDYLVPINLLHIKSGIGATKVHFPPFTQAISNKHACLLYVVDLVRNGGTVNVCSGLTCPGGVGLRANCLADLSVPSSDTQARIRASITAAGFNGAALTNSLMQTSTSNLCDGQVVTEFAINIMPSASTTTNTALNVVLSLLAQPRDHGQRCNAAGPAPLLCFQTNLTNIFPQFGDADGDVCASDFLLTGNPAVDFPNPANQPSSVDDPTLLPIGGDILDTSFSVSTRVPTCQASANFPVPELCTVQTRRLCFSSASECGL